jgi:hypothetical protein
MILCIIYDTRGGEWLKKAGTILSKEKTRKILPLCFLLSGRLLYNDVISMEIYNFGQSLRWTHFNDTTKTIHPTNRGTFQSKSV